MSLTNYSISIKFSIITPNRQCSSSCILLCSVFMLVCFFGSTFTPVFESLDLIMEHVEYILEIVARRIKSRIKPKPRNITLFDL